MLPLNGWAWAHPLKMANHISSSSNQLLVTVNNFWHFIVYTEFASLFEVPKSKAGILDRFQIPQLETPTLLICSHPLLVQYLL